MRRAEEININILSLDVREKQWKTGVSIFHTWVNAYRDPGYIRHLCSSVGPHYVAINCFNAWDCAH